MVGLLNQITAYRESRNRDFDQYGRPIVSPKGARFAMQVMPSTARDPGFGLRPANPNDPNDMNRLGREYRAAMETRYGGDPAKMWSAYNGGPGRTDRAIARGGANWLGLMPRETRDYVGKNVAMLGQNQRRRNPIAAALEPPQQPLNDEPMFGGMTPEQMRPEIMPAGQYAAAPAPLPEKKPGAFGKGGKGWMILGALGDAMAAYGGQRGAFMPAMLDMQAREAEETRFRERIAAQNAAAMERMQFKIANPTPRQPTQTDRYAEEVLDPRTPEPRRRLLMQILTRPQTIVGADGSTTQQYGMPPAAEGDDDEWSYN